MRAESTISRRRAVLVVLGAIALVGCKRSDAPTEPVWGKEPCAHCRMLVSDKRYAAQLIDETGEHRFFDDTGCMVLWMEAHKPAERAWVHESTSSTWVDARTAHYVAGARTPMDFGFEARTGGEVRFDAVRAAVLEKKKGTR